MKKGYLVLQDGQVFEGFRFGGPADAVGELVFTAFSGSHQDAINKGTRYMEESGTDHRHVRLSGDTDGSQLCWTDRDADLSSDRQLWDHSGGF